MKIMPMGDYYVWHCDWCDSTNYTIWTRMERDGLSCTACHHHASLLTDDCGPVLSPVRIGIGIGDAGHCHL